jgi:hypothetical protein
VVALLLVTIACLVPGGRAAGAAPLPDTACRYVTAISASSPAATPAELDAVTAPGSDAAKYAVFERDLRDAWVAAQNDPTRRVRCGRSKVEVGLLQQPRLPINPPKKITTVYKRFVVDPSGRVESFTVNGTPIDGRVLVGSGPATTALGTTVSVSSAYRVPPGGGEHIRAADSLVVAVRATAPADGLRDLATGSSLYRTPTGDQFLVHAVGQGSAIPPGASAVWALEFDSTEFGGSLTVPVVSTPAAQAGPDTPLAPAVLTVG